MFQDFCNRSNVQVEALFILIMTFVITERVNAILVKQEIMDSLNQIKDHINNPKAILLEFLGKPEDAINKVIYNTSRARSINNTYVLQINADQKGVLSGYTTEYSDKIVNSVCDFIKREKTWIDIISSQGENRIKKLNNRLNEKKIKHDTYHIYKVPYEFPIINFIIFEYSNTEREVFFGWGLHTQAPLDSVFSSTDERVIGVFERYFHSLSRACGDELDLKTLDSSTSPQIQ
jgi:hypothetical protein